MDLTDAMTIKLDYELPEYPAFQAGCRRAPRREAHLSQADKALASTQLPLYSSMGLPQIRPWGRKR